MALDKWIGKIAAKKTGKRGAHFLIALLASKGIGESLGITVNEPVLATALATAVYCVFVFVTNWLKHKIPKLGAIL